MNRPRLGDRSLFPELVGDAFLSHAAVSPLSAPVVDAITGAMGDFARHGVAAVRPWVAQRDRLRGKLADLIGANAEEIGLVPSTSQGVIAVARSIDFVAGDRILLFRGEFPTNVTPWQQIADERGCEIVWLETSDVLLSQDSELVALRAILEQGVKLVAISAVQFQTGWRMPLEEIGALCREHGARLFVDAIQAVGCVPLDVDACKIDYLASGSHKWLMGPEGAGFVYIRQERFTELTPRHASWLSHEDALLFLFEGPGELRYDRPIRKQANFVEMSAVNTLGYAGLEASLDMILELGVDAIFAHVDGYLDTLEDRICDELSLISARSRHPAHRSGILSFEIPPEIPNKELGDTLVKRGIVASTPDGLLRFAPHWPNDAEREHDAILHTLTAVLKELG